MDSQSAAKPSGIGPSVGFILGLTMVALFSIFLVWVFRWKSSVIPVSMRVEPAHSADHGTPAHDSPAVGHGQESNPAEPGLGGH